jgi:uncharacterized protein YecT (DUF1311 family)
MWECSKCGQRSDKKLSDSNGCEHQWWDEHDIAKAKEKQAKEEKINRAVFAFNDELLNTEDGQKRLKGESGWSWLKGNKGGDKINAENIDIDKDIATCWLNSFFGKKWLVSEYGKEYANYLNDTKIWAKDKFLNVSNYQKIQDEAKLLYVALGEPKNLSIDKVALLVEKGFINYEIYTHVRDGYCYVTDEEIIYKKKYKWKDPRNNRLLRQTENATATHLKTAKHKPPKPEPQNSESPKAATKTPNTIFSDEERRKMFADFSGNLDNQQPRYSFLKPFILLVGTFLIVYFFFIIFSRGDEIKAMAEAAAIAAAAETARAEAVKPKPSFDCEKASTPSEKTICSNADLAELDSRLAIAYYQARSSACKKDLQKQQREWLNKRNSCSSNIQCLKNSYNSRIQKLERCQ